MDDLPDDLPSLAGDDRPDPTSDDAVFKALADPTRRALLDKLRAQDGQRQTDLEQGLPMTRFGVAKHLRVLEDAGLVVIRKHGRDKLHFLNPAPLQRAYDRWVSAYARPWVGFLTDLARSLENPTVSTATATATASVAATAVDAATVPFVYPIVINAAPERVWQGLTDPAITPRYYFNSAVEGEWRPGGAYRYAAPDGSTLLDGEVLEADAPRRLVTTFRPHWMGNAEVANVSRVAWEIAPAEGGASTLTLTHEGLTDGEAGVRDGWVGIVSGLKTALEAGAA